MTKTHHLVVNTCNGAAHLNGETGGFRIWLFVISPPPRALYGHSPATLSRLSQSTPVRNTNRFSLRLWASVSVGDYTCSALILPRRAPYKHFVADSYVLRMPSYRPTNLRFGFNCLVNISSNVKDGRITLEFRNANAVLFSLMPWDASLQRTPHHIERSSRCVNSQTAKIGDPHRLLGLCCRSEDRALVALKDPQPAGDVWTVLELAGDAAVSA